MILICADTLRSDHLGQNGYGRDTSPHLDALAKGGARFERCFSTYPQTAASVASIFTSRYASAHKVSAEEMQLSPLPALLAETLLAAGYRTGAVASNPHLTPGLGFERGFERYTYIHGRNQKRSSYEVEAGELQSGVEFRQSKGSYYGRGDDINLAALEWLDADAGKQPFYLYLHYMDVHSPYISPEPFQDKFVQAPGKNAYRNGLAKGVPSQANRDFTKARYDAGIGFLDHSIGQLVSELEARDLLRDTYIVFTSDHGDEFMEHGGFGHGQTLYREMTQVPLLISGPGVESASLQRAVSTVDIFPTICDLLGLSNPAGLQGRSLSKWILGQDDAHALAAPHGFSEGFATRSPDGAMRARIALYDDRWHLILHPEDGLGELFDYHADPSEQKNLWNEQPEVVARLSQRALDLQRASRELGQGIEGRRAELGAATQDALKDLGYVETDEDE
jgi:arylsulfatase A-like enzyme